MLLRIYQREVTMTYDGKWGNKNYIYTSLVDYYMRVKRFSGGNKLKIQSTNVGSIPISMVLGREPEEYKFQQCTLFASSDNHMMNLQETEDFALTLPFPYPSIYNLFLVGQILNIVENNDIPQLINGQSFLITNYTIDQDAMKHNRFECDLTLLRFDDVLNIS